MYNLSHMDNQSKELKEYIEGVYTKYKDKIDFLSNSVLKVSDEFRNDINNKRLEIARKNIKNYD